MTAQEAMACVDWLVAYCRPLGLVLCFHRPIKRVFCSFVKASFDERLCLSNYSDDIANALSSCSEDNNRQDVRLKLKPRDLSGFAFVPSTHPHASVFEDALQYHRLDLFITPLESVCFAYSFVLWCDWVYLELNTSIQTSMTDGRHQ